MIYYTSIEQSKKLLELGLNPDSADMFYCYGMNTTTKEWSYDKEPSVNGTELHFDVGDVPCWSLGALLNMMPKCIVVGGRNYFSYIATLDTISYGDTEGYMTIKFSYDSLFESCFQMVIWLLENGFIKK